MSLEKVDYSNLEINGDNALESKKNVTKPYVMKYVTNGILHSTNVVSKSKKYVSFKEFVDDEFKNDELIHKMQNQYADFLQVPDTISSEIRELARTITAGTEKKSEKVKKIIDYLSKNYKYTLKVSEVPKNTRESKLYCRKF